MDPRTLSDNTPMAQPKTYGSGEKLSASKLNEGVRAAQGTTTGVRPPMQIVPVPINAKVASGVTQYRITAIKDDYLVCKAWDGSVESGDIVYVAKPWTLRTLVSRNSIAYSDYAETTSLQRTATRSNSSETQVVVPTYAVQDIIYAVAGIAGGTGASRTNTDDESLAIGKLDMNVDARAWCRKN